MLRRSIALLFASLLGFPLISGCNSETKPDVAPAPNGLDYGTNKMPPADEVTPKPGKGPKGPGAPPLRR